MRFAVYLLVGAVAWLVDLAVYHFIWPLAGIAVAQLAARITGAITAFLLNRSKTFQVKNDMAGFVPQAIKYSVLLALNWMVSVGLIYAACRGLGIHPVTAKIFVDIIVVPSNYFVLKHWVFPQTHTEVKQ